MSKVKRSCLDKDHPGYQPIFPKAGWKRDIKSKEMALKRANWFKGVRENESWKGLPTSTSSGRIHKRKIFQKAGGKGKMKKAAATVVFVPSKKGQH